MSNFGPRIFHAACQYADCHRDNSFETEAYPPRAGLDIVDSFNGRLTSTNMERIKNGIFKLFLARARNELQNRDETCDKEVTVTVTLTFSDETFHPNKKMSSSDENMNKDAADLQKITLARTLLVKKNTSLDRDFDNYDIINSLEQQSIACGPRNLMDNALRNDAIYNKLNEW